MYTIKEMSLSLRCVYVRCLGKYIRNSGQKISLIIIRGKS